MCGYVYGSERVHPTTTASLSFESVSLRGLWEAMIDDAVRVTRYHPPPTRPAPPPHAAVRGLDPCEDEEEEPLAC